MAFLQSSVGPRQFKIHQSTREETSSTSISPPKIEHVNESQGWILCPPLHNAPSKQHKRTGKPARTNSLSHGSEFGSLTAKSGPSSQQFYLDDDHTEDGDFDSLDEGLQAFRDETRREVPSACNSKPVLPVHDGLGTFPPSRISWQEQLRRYERYNPKRKFAAVHPAEACNSQRHDETGENDIRISEDKRSRIEQWRLEQSRALLVEVEKETRRRKRRRSNSMTSGIDRSSENAHSASKDPSSHSGEEIPSGKESHVDSQGETIWKRITRRFMQDVIGIDEPLLSVIVGETLPDDICAIAELASTPNEDKAKDVQYTSDTTWPDRLLHRIARELGLLVHKLSVRQIDKGPYPTMTPLEYAGIPLSAPSMGKESLQSLNQDSRSSPTPLFSPTIEHAGRYSLSGLDDKPKDIPAPGFENELQRLRGEQEYWERELDVKMVFQFLKSRFSSKSSPRQEYTERETKTSDVPSAPRTDVIKQQHPLVRTTRQPSSPMFRIDSHAIAMQHIPSSCASESMKSDLISSSNDKRIGGSHGYYDVAASNTSGSIFGSDGRISAWGQV